MQRNFKLATGIAAALAAVFAVYAARSHTWTLQPGVGRAEPSTVSSARTPAARKMLYWKHPDALLYSGTAQSTVDGRAFIPIYDDQEPDFPESKPAAAAVQKGGPRKLLYYRNPMGLADTSPVPKKDWMGMDYIAVYEGEEEEAGTVKVSLDKVQRSGVRTARVERQTLVQTIRAPGTAKADERTLRIVALRADGFVEKLYVNETGKAVRAGEPLFRVYSPLMVSAQVDYRTATSGGLGGRNEVGGLQKLKNLEVPEAVVEALRKGEPPQMSFDWPSPATGVVLQKRVIEGQMARAGEELYRIADLTTIWVIADVAEQDVGLVTLGALAKLSFRALPGQVFEGRVSFVLHELDAATRTAKARIEVKNPDLLLKHEMYADVEIAAGAAQAPALLVPLSALIDSGNRQVVIVAKGEGRFQPRAVKVGRRSSEQVELLEGVQEGDDVVTSANFLIDAESNLKAALQAFSAPAEEGERKP
jgi:Cu(I)/Ag(I) efflux system membrane fusion protein